MSIMDFNNKKNREELKFFFQKNSIPTASNFADLIDGLSNYKDDGLLKSLTSPLMIRADQQDKAVELHRASDNNTAVPVWSLSLTQPDGKKGFGIDKMSSAGQFERNILFIDETTGNIGLNNTNPKTKLHINGDVRIDGIIHQGKWISATLSEGWTSKDGVYGIKYFKDSFGFVHVKGTACLQGATFLDSIFIFPEEYKPETMTIFPCLSYDVVDRNSLCQISVTQDGEVRVSGLNVLRWICLDGINFMASSSS